MTAFFFLLLILSLLSFGSLAMTISQPLADEPIGCLDRCHAAKYLSISTRLLDSLAAEGEIIRIKIGRKSVFRVADLDAFVESKVQRLKPGA